MSKANEKILQEAKMITNNSCRKLPIIRRYTAKNIPDNKCMRKTNLRKTYIPFSLSEADTENMSVIYIFDDFQIYTKLGSGLSVILKLENWTIHPITGKLMPITFYSARR